MSTSFPATNVITLFKDGKCVDLGDELISIDKRFERLRNMVTELDTYISLKFETEYEDMKKSHKMVRDAGASGNPELMKFAKEASDKMDKVKEIPRQLRNIEDEVNENSSKLWGIEHSLKSLSSFVMSLQKEIEKKQDK